MGTLYSQRPRQETVDLYVSSITQVLREYMGVKDPTKATPAQWHAACDAVRTAFLLQDGDARDEQLAGFGEIAQELVRWTTETVGFGGVRDQDATQMQRKKRKIEFSQV